VCQEVFKNRVRAIPEHLERTRTPHADRLVFTILHGFPGAKRDVALTNEPHRADGVAVSPEGKFETLVSRPDFF
jgi:hypothetical protein